VRRSVANRAGQGEDLSHGQHRTLGRGLLVSALDPARVTADQPVIDRGVEDRPGQAVRLRCGDPGIEQSHTPAADPGEGDTGNSDRIEVRRDVGAQQPSGEIAYA
jgi:cation diffusion facilitator CzcD-associated flavoprotein CzcO